MDAISEFIDGLVEAIIGTREQTQDDYALVGPGK